MRYIRQASIVTVFLVSLALTAKAQETLTPLGSKTVESPDLLDVPELTLEQIREQEQQAEAVLQLRDIQTSLDVKRIARKGLRRKLGDANSSAKEDIQFELDEIDSEIELLEMTFEQIAIGGIDLSVFGIKEKSFDWREELVLIVKPLIENVKSLTEKPRKIESLRRFISNKVAAKQASRDALESIERIKKEAVSNSVLQNLSNIESDWLSRLDDLDREIQLAEYQLDSLEGKNVPWFQIFKQGSLDFISGRGLTILLLFLAAGIVWAFMRSILWLIRKRTRDSSDRSSKTHYRLAAYGYRLLTAILIAMAIMMVLYFRQDLLLLAVMVVIFIGAALALKNLLPTYITESRLLLNMGSVREKERVIYNGLPWEVSNINMYSLLTNPKIRGGVRLPISHMHEMISRPSVGDTWFPSSEGDWILDAAGDPVKVIRQSVDVIELEDLDSVKRFMPSQDYYRAGYPNLTRAENFRIALIFGIDYATQAEDIETIEQTFKEGIQKSFVGTPYAEHILEINTDFHSAGDSSLNYLMLTKFKPEAAEYYNRIKRRIQRACVTVCNENNWGIPFPQLSVHLPSSDEKNQDI